ARARWICTRLAEAQERQQRLQASRIQWGDGAALPYLGQPLVLRRDARLRHGPGAAVLQAATPENATPALHLGLPPEASPAQWRDAAQAWLMRQARRHFTARLDHFAPRMGVRWQTLGLSSARTRWGSASAGGAIRLHWRLIHLRPAVIDYVVVHELAHLHEMNHGPRFWAHVHATLPDYAALRAELRGETLPAW
ncbi:MAG: SprT family zinc-dependent metalloprotease, partial [Comamonadaceae bacterium]|nr:SprT family zinc-dependent metalloprotease [Comamonadaceae bacterium]